MVNPMPMLNSQPLPSPEIMPLANQPVEEDRNPASSGQRVPQPSESQIQPWTADHQRTHGPGSLHDRPPDYQMQLIFLRQQNMRRLLAKRDALLSQYETKEAPLDAPASQAPVNFQNIVIQAESSSQVQSVDTPAHLPSESETNRKIQETPRKKRKQSTTASPDRPVGPTSAREYARFDTATFSLTPASNFSPSKEIHHRMIYRVFCSRDVIPTLTLYFDTPRRVFNGERHMRQPHYHFSGSDAATDLKQLLTGANSLAFLVFCSVKCDDFSKWDIRQSQAHVTNSSSIWEESIAVIDPSLRTFIDSIAKFSHQLEDYSQTEERTSSDPFKNTSEDEYHHRFFYHHREALSSLIPSIPNPSRGYIEHLLRFLHAKHGLAYNEADKHFAEGLVHRDNLDILFCPNEVVISKQNGCLAAYVLCSLRVGHSTLNLDCWSLVFDGQRLRRKHCALKVLRPDKTASNIRDLEVYPLRYATDEEKDYLRRRGQKFWDLRYPNLATYTRWNVEADHYYSNEARCMIDYKTYRKVHPAAEVFEFLSKPIAPFDKWPESIAHDATPDHHQLLLLPPYIHGFSLKEKKWMTLLVDNFGPVTWNKDAYERLVLPRRTKDLIKGLVMVRKSKIRQPQDMSLTGKRGGNDLIAGNGDGLIILLHGGPGTGKTLTAESIAEIAEMPLYSVTCGDLGASADAIEKSLQTVMMLGQTWNCVLLFEGADVFLEERRPSDLERTRMVSAFQRMLQQYDGIVILTSDQAGTFDEAFRSRIQLALHYKNLDKVARKKVWKNFFDMLETDKEDMNLEELNEHMDELADQAMNGHQIRRALTTARQLAVYQKETLGWEHLEQAVMTARDFDKYLQALHGRRDEQ